ncbi:MAG: NADH-quinone oxidoreductase subunit N [Acidimicrobiia bacterium]|nr:NADH-quinone oxidoreductase subunit N [Acidimicrobiia bacterium]
MTGTLATTLAPEIGLFVLAVVVLLIGVIQRGDQKRVVGWITGIGLLGVLGSTLRLVEGGSVGDGMFVNDGLAIFAKQLLLGAGVISILGSLTLGHASFSRRSAEYHFALLASLLGMMALVSARDLLLFFVAFELMSIPLYVLTGFLKRDEATSEAALKFFLVGTVSAAFIVYGISFIYGVTGSTAIDTIPRALAEGQPLTWLGMGLMLVGLAFKIAAFPFHMWVPDVYEAATTPFVAWLAVAPKAAGFVAIIRLYVAGSSASDTWLPVIVALAGVTTVAGNLMAIPQRNIKRLLAYSGVAHIGYMLIGLAALSDSGVAMVLFYLVAYLFGNMGAFMVVEAVARSERSEGIDAYAGLAQRSPLLALAMLIFLLSLGGIPFVAGFWAKLYLFLAAAEKGLYGLVFLGAVLTVVALYYYLLVARRMYIDAPVCSDRVRVPGLLGAAIATCAAGVVGIGVYPAPWVDLVKRVASALF